TTYAERWVWSAVVRRPATPAVWAGTLAIDECSIKRNYVYATIFSDPARGVVIDVAPGRDGAAIWAFAGLYRRNERALVAIVTIDCHNAYRYMVRLAFPHAMVVTDAFHLHRQVLEALTKVRRL